MAIPKSIHFNVEGNKITTWTGQGLGAYAFYGVLGITIVVLGIMIGTSWRPRTTETIRSLTIILLSLISPMYRAAQEIYWLCFDGNTRTIYKKTALGRSRLMPFDEVEDIIPIQMLATWNARVYFRLTKKGGLPGKGIRMTDTFELSEHGLADDAENFVCFQKEVLPMLRDMLRLPSSLPRPDKAPAEKADIGHVIHCGREVVLPMLRNFIRWLIAIVVVSAIAFAVFDFEALKSGNFIPFFEGCGVLLALLMLISLSFFPLLTGTPVRVTLDKEKRSFIITPLLRPKQITAPFSELQYFKITDDVVTMHLKSLKKGVPLTILRDPAEGEKFLPNLLAAAGIRRDIPVYYADRAPLANFKELPKKK